LAYDVYFGLKAPGGSGWLGETSSPDAPEQLDQDGIIRAPSSIGGVKATSYFFSPFGIERNVMVGVLQAGGASDGYVLLNFHMGSPDGQGGANANGEKVRVIAASKAIVEEGSGGGAMVYVPIGGVDGQDCDDPFAKGKAGQELGQQGGCSRTADDIAVGFQKKLDANGWMGVVAGFVENAADADTLAGEIVTWIAGRTPDKVLDDDKKEWETWRKPPPDGVLCSDDEKKVWRMGEATLRMGQVREPNIPGRKNNGMIVASLPVGQWHTGWVRDMAYAVVGLARSGHFEEAKMGLNFWMNAEPVGQRPELRALVKNQNYRIALTRYFGSGEEETDWENGTGWNQQLDGWGLVLWAARSYVDLSKDYEWLDSPSKDGKVWEVLKSGIAGPLEANLESNGIVTADCSIWEVHDARKKHFAYTTLAAARGFCDMAGMAKLTSRDGDLKKYQDLEKKVREAFLSTYVDPQGALAGNIEELSTGQYIDAAVAEAFTWNILRDWKGTTAKATLDLLEKMRVDSGGYKRNDDGLSSYDNNEWILVDFRVANAYRRAGNKTKADGILAQVVNKSAANFYILPELFNATASEGQIGKMYGEIPMVGYGGGAFIMTVLDRAGIGEPDDCGDGQGSKLEKLDCSGVSTNPGGPGDPNNPGGPGADGNQDGVPDASEIPFVNACLCTTGPHRGLTPMGVVLVLGLPLLGFGRRRFRR
jgi:GH15 family glucan-1,4-alpha-glucosidase